MTVDDLPAVEAIATIVHHQFFERPAVFAERLALWPAGCLLLESDGTAAGYVVSHPFVFGTFPALDQLLGGLPERADTYYLHDLALVPRVRGTGAAGQVVAQLLEQGKALGFPSASLVAVSNSQEFWRRQGFVTIERRELFGKLGSYEPNARLMVRML